jgi:hypothetical protein
MEELLAVLGSSRTSLGPERGATTISTTAAILEKVPPNRPARPPCPPARPACVRACEAGRACATTGGPMRDAPLGGRAGWPAGLTISGRTLQPENSPGPHALCLSVVPALASVRVRR